MRCIFINKHKWYFISCNRFHLFLTTWLDVWNINNSPIIGQDWESVINPMEYWRSLVQYFYHFCTNVLKQMSSFSSHNFSYSRSVATRVQERAKIYLEICGPDMTTRGVGFGVIWGREGATKGREKDQTRSRLW